MRITLKPGDTIPVDAKFCYATFNKDVWTGLTVEVPDPTPPAPKMIVFVADGEPRRYSGDATHYLNIMGDFLYCGAGDTDDRDRQHYRQLPAEYTLTLEDLREIRRWDEPELVRKETYNKVCRIIAAMEARNA